MDLPIKPGTISNSQARLPAIALVTALLLHGAVAEEGWTWSSHGPNTVCRKTSNLNDGSGYKSVTTLKPLSKCQATCNGIDDCGIEYVVSSGHCETWVPKPKYFKAVSGFEVVGTGLPFQSTLRHTALGF